MNKAWVVKGRIKYRARFLVFAQSKEEAEKKARESENASDWLPETHPMVDLFTDQTVPWVEDGEKSRNEVKVKPHEIGENGVCMTCYPEESQDEPRKDDK